MNLATRKFNFIQEITNMDELLLAKLELVLQANKKDWFDELSSDEKQEIKLGLQEADTDQMMSHNEVMSQFAKWH